METQLTTLAAQLATLKADNARLATEAAARQAAEQRAATLADAANQLASTKQQLDSARADNARLSEQTQALDRDRAARLAQMQQENSALTARLRQAQGALDQIAAATHLISPGPSSPPPVTDTPAPVARPTASPAEAVYHIVTEGESLSHISLQHYGTASRWQDIYDANRDVLKGENSLRPGQRLRIP